MDKPKKEKGKLGNWFNKLKTRYRVVVVDDKTFDEKWHVRLSPMFLVLFFGGGAIVIIALTTVLIAYTPLREYIPGYPDGTEKESVYENKRRIDSLEQAMEQQSFYVERIKTLLNDGVIDDTTLSKDSIHTPLDPSALKRADKNEKEFREKIEDKEKNSVSHLGTKTSESNTYAYFYTPVNGVVSQSFNRKKQHNGVDISTAKDEPVKAALSGTVVFAGYTTEGGNEIHIQHNNNITTIYKHNAYLMAQTGQRVRAGETIATAGNTGEQSKGHHLHFEIWDNGIAVDPEDFIGF